MPSLFPHANATYNALWFSFLQPRCPPAVSFEPRVSFRIPYAFVYLKQLTLCLPCSNISSHEIEFWMICSSEDAVPPLVDLPLSRWRVSCHSYCYRQSTSQRRALALEARSECTFLRQRSLMSHWGKMDSDPGCASETFASVEEHGPVPQVHAME